MISKMNAPPTPIWSLQGPELRSKRGETLDIAFGNELPVPAVLNWRGIDGVPAAEPLTDRPPLAAGGKDALQLPLRHAGTFLCDLTLLAGLTGLQMLYLNFCTALRDLAPLAGLTSLQKLR